MDLVSAFRLGELERRRVRVRWGLVAQFPAPQKSRGCAPCFSARRPTALRHRRPWAFRPAACGAEGRRGGGAEGWW
ncbi:hypothetical protein PV367_41520, partial [Streptomyces europaeiscabiei]